VRGPYNLKKRRQARAQKAREILRESQQDFKRNNPEGYTETGVQRLIKEYRAEMRAGSK
jgi:hypothetical protein